MVWSIWKRRNNQVWENITETAQTVCERARHLITSWRNAQNYQSLANITQSAPQQTKWSKPSIGRYKCNIDASFSHSTNKVGIGICIRDEHGQFVAARTEWMEPILDVEVGEAMGLLSALIWVVELQLHNMDFEMDCKRVVDGLYSNRTYTSDLGAILSDCRLILATSFVNSHIKFIRRQANEVAHTLTRVSTSLASFHNFIDIPICIYNIIINEMR
jgi:ribonuclease HI